MSLENELKAEAAKIRTNGGHSPITFLLDRAASELAHLRDLVKSYNDMARGR